MAIKDTAARTSRHGDSRQADPGQHRPAVPASAPVEPVSAPAAPVDASAHARFGHSLSRIAVEAAPVQRKQQPGLPDGLGSGVEGLSGHSLDDISVHSGSSQPAALQAHAYAQGSDIHMGVGQEQPLPHEAWHVAQQSRGRVDPTSLEE